MKTVPVSLASTKHLYDIGFDKPETHAIRKRGNMYYAFYAPQWNGKVTLRGLEMRSYRVADYVNRKDLGTVQGSGGDTGCSLREAFADRDEAAIVARRDG